MEGQPHYGAVMARAPKVGRSPRATDLPGAAKAGRGEKMSYTLARHIASDIASLRVKPGDMLPSEALMLDTYQVGRSSLREALRILEIQGIITIKPGPGGGPVVSEPESADFSKILALHFHVRQVPYRELVEARISLEPMAARLAAERVDDETIALLQTHLRDAAAIPDADVDQIAFIWHEFHYLVGSLSGNGVVHLLTRSLGELYRERVVLRQGSPQSELGRRTSDEAHAQIAAAIIAGKATRAERLMREHMAELSASVAERQSELMDEVITWG